MLPPAGYISDAARTHGELKQALEDIRDQVADQTDAAIPLTPSGGDDTAAIQAAIDTAALSKGRVGFGGGTYFISSTISLKSDILLDCRGAKFLMRSGAGQFDNTDPSNGARYGTNAVGMKADGVHRWQLWGGEFEYEGGIQDRYTRALSTHDCDDFLIAGLDAWNFTHCTGILAINGGNRGKIFYCHLHDCLLDSATFGQLTGINIDDDSPVDSCGDDGHV